MEDKQHFYKKPWLEVIVVCGILLATVIVFTWPLALHLKSAIAVGSEPPAVARFQLFCAQWTGLALEEGRPYLEAPFFYPFKGVFSWTEAQLFTCILIWLISKAAGYILAYNIIIFAYLLLLGLSGYCLARLLSEDRLAALWCASWLAGGAYALEQICALPLLSAGLGVFCIYFLFLFFIQKRLRFFWIAVLFYSIFWLCCKQLALFLTLFLPLLIAPFFSFHKLKKVSWFQILLAAGFIAVILYAGVLVNYAYIKPMGLERGPGEIIHGLSVPSLFIPAKGHWLGRYLSGARMYSWDIGIVMVLTIICAALAGIFKAPPVDRYSKRIIKGLTVMAVAAFLVSLGPGLGVTIHGRDYGIYPALLSFVPGLNLVRVAARAIFFTHLAVALLAQAALAYLRSGIKPGIGRFFFTFLFFGLLWAEMWTVPLRLFFPGEEIKKERNVINWLSRNGAGKPVLELPLHQGFMAKDSGPQVDAMLRMLYHGNPVVNGYASFAPYPFRQLKQAANFISSAQLGRYLQAYGVRLVVVHNHKIYAGQERYFQEALGDDIVFSDGRDSIYLLPQGKNVVDFKQSLPAYADFGETPPKAGKLYGLLLDRPLAQAVLIQPQPAWSIVLRWVDGVGRRKEKRVRMLGSVILDTTCRRIYFRILRLPEDARQGEAKLVSAEEATVRSKKSTTTLKQFEGNVKF